MGGSVLRAEQSLRRCAKNLELSKVINVSNNFNKSFDREG